jgi:hypothetical protein
MISDQRRDYYAGGLVFLIGVGAATIATRYQIGSLTKMGPGFFPFSLGIFLAFLGVMIALTNYLSAATVPAAPDLHHSMQSSPDWRGWGCIIGSVLTFIFLAEFAGLLPAIFLCVFVACWGDRTARLLDSALLSGGITIFGILLFSYVLRVQIPIIRGL